MSADAVIGWVLTLSWALRLSQSKPLADLVEAVWRVSRGTLSVLGRCLPHGTAAKHKIKRVWRFCDNDRVHVADVMPAVVRRLCRNRKKPLLVARDWTDIRSFHTLMAAAVLRGRAVPLGWASYTDGQLFRSQNSLEEGLLRLLVSMLPEGARVILLCDRGFGRTELARTCQDLGIRFLIRIKPDVTVTHPSYTGQLCDYPVRKGIWRVLKGCQYQSDRAVPLTVVIRWKRGLPAQRDKPWFLMTDLGGHRGVPDRPVGPADGGGGAVPGRQGRPAQGVQRRDRGPLEVGPDRRAARGLARSRRSRLARLGPKLGMNSGSDPVVRYEPGVVDLSSSA